MVKTSYDLRLDVRQQTSPQSNITLVQGDNSVYDIIARIYDGGAEVDYSEIDHAWIVFSKPDKTVVQGIMVPKESPEKGYRYTLGSNDIAAIGKVLVAVLLYGEDGQRISTSRFEITVLADLLTSTSVESSSQMDALTAVIADIEQRLENGEFIGEQGPKGEEGRGFNPLSVYETESELRAEHPTGAEGDQYIVGDGEIETTYIYIWDVDQNDWVNAGRVCDQGPSGEDGITFTPSVDENGDLSWTNDGGLTNPDTVNIKGSDGATGAPGAPGADGVSPHIDEATGRWFVGDTDTGVAADTIVVSDFVSTTKSQAVTYNREYRFGTLTSLTISVPDMPGGGVVTGHYDASVAFTSGSTATALTIVFADGGMLGIMRVFGTDVVANVLTPVANKRYSLAIWYDGAYTNIAVSGVSTS